MSKLNIQQRDWDVTDEALADQWLRTPVPDWALSAAERIFSLFSNASYFSTRNAEHRKQMLEGWAEIIRSSAPASVRCVFCSWGGDKLYKACGKCLALDIRACNAEQLYEQTLKQLRDAVNTISRLKEVEANLLSHVQTAIERQDSAEADRDSLRVALVEAAIPLEAIALAVDWELSPTIMTSVNEAVSRIRDCVSRVQSKGAR